MATIAVLAFFVVLGVVVFFLAMRVGAGDRPRPLRRMRRGPKRALVLGIFVVYAGFGLALPAVLLAANSGHDRNGPAGVKLTAAEARGRVLFGHTCNECHTLAAAGTVGRTGPNLDQLQPPQSLVLYTIEHGLDRGNGRMPQGLLQGRDAQDVAAFVAAVAGK